jgi:Fe-Mn family superoxide dismutase
MVEFTLAPLPYAKNALEPHISSETVEVHYEKHHRGYVNKLNELLKERPHRADSLEALVQTSVGELYENAAQVWNHDLYWRSLTPGGGGAVPDGELARAVEREFGRRDTLGARIVERGKRLFGSGYVWLAWSPDHDQILLDGLSDADSPLLQDRVPLLAIDVWEHAYYLDRKNERAAYLEACVEHLIDWGAAEKRLLAARKRHASGNKTSVRSSSSRTSFGSSR